MGKAGRREGGGRGGTRRVPGRQGWGGLPLRGEVRVQPDSPVFSGSCPTFPLKSCQAWACGDQGPHPSPPPLSSAGIWLLLSGRGLLAAGARRVH